MVWRRATLGGLTGGQWPGGSQSRFKPLTPVGCSGTNYTINNYCSTNGMLKSVSVDNTVQITIQLQLITVLIMSLCEHYSRGLQYMALEPYVAIYPLSRGYLELQLRTTQTWVFGILINNWNRCVKQYSHVCSRMEVIHVGWAHSFQQKLVHKLNKVRAVHSFPSFQYI